MPDLKQAIRDVPDFPRPGILFRDIAPLLRDHFDGTIEALDVLLTDEEWDEVDALAGVESRGFILGAALAIRRRKGFVLVRKQGKLPPPVVDVAYDLEYGSDSLEMHKDAVGAGSRVLIVDDLLATGGTAAAVARLVEQAGGTVAGLGFAIELTFLHGRQKLAGYDVFSLLEYDQ